MKEYNKDFYYHEKGSALTMIIPGKYRRGLEILITPLNYPRLSGK
jgi:hypothetical protein